ncbi:MAG: redoxin domain-containing protein [Promethearchaeota archaeon]|nr:MAG: redoxin domain-containing protein [Candidatus Lokiarchaeota archaeon]
MSTEDIKIGQDAPLFKLQSYNAGMIDLEELIGSQKIVLIFSRYFGCPICHLELNQILERYEEIEDKGAKLLYITQSGDKIAKEFIKNKGITFPVIASTKDDLYKEYGLGMMTPEAVKQVRKKVKEAFAAGIEHGEYEGWEQQGEGQFIIDEQGKIIHARKGWLDLDSMIEIL